MESREQLVVAVSAALFLAVGSAIAVLAPSHRPASLPLAVGLVVGYALVMRVRFEVASEYVSAEQVVFVPMLLLLPLGEVPLLVAAAAVLAVIPELVREAWDGKRWMVSIADCWFSVGPVLVLILLAPGEPTLGQAPFYAVAFVAQFIGDSLWALLRYELLHPIPFKEFAGFCLGTAQVDAILSPLAFVITLVAVQHSYVLLVIAPLVWLLQMFSRDRTARYSATLELNRAYRGTVMLLTDVVEHEDRYTASHCRSVVELVQATAEEMGVDLNSRQELEFAALLHDVGKISIPKEILNKPASLTAEEWELIKTDTIEGQFMLDRVGGLLGRVGELVRSCHERWDGHGYPDGLAGEEIPLEARIVFVCDAYNAMTTDRPYRSAKTREEALAELRANSGTQFDPDVVVAVTKIVEAGEPETRSIDEMRALVASVHVRQDVSDGAAA